MNTASNDPQNLERKVELRIRTLRILWAALTVSILLYFLFAFFTKQPATAVANNTLFFVLLAVTLSLFIVSLAVKPIFLNRAIEQQNVTLLQQGYLVTWVVNEAGALLGLFGFFVTGNPYFFVLFFIAFCGQLFHFPRREHVLDVYFKSRP